MKSGTFIRRHKNQRGQVIVLATAAMVVLIGFVGVVVDVGNLYTTRRKMQTAADAAAIAAANVLLTSDSSGYSNAATDVAGFNGFTNSSNGVTVTVSSPTSCPNASGEQCVQVNVSQAVPTYFLRVLGYSTMNVSTQAIAGGTNNPACIYALDPSDSQSLSIGATSSSAFTFKASCGAIVNSNSSSGLYLNGAGTFTTTGTGVAGNQVYSHGAVRMTPTPVTNVIPALDPLASLPPPTYSGCTQLTTTSSTQYKQTGAINSLTVPANTLTSGGILFSNVAAGSITFPAGNYGNNIFLSGAISNLTFNPGQYQNTGGTGDSIDVTGSGNTNFNGGGYTFCGKVNVTGANTITLRPGVYVGGISITGAANVTFQPGTYIIAGGGFTVNNSAATISGSGVTFYNTTGPAGFAPFAISGASSSSLSAPTSGTYKGILFFTDRSIPVGTAGYTNSGASTITTDGVWYFPTTTVEFNGASSGSGYTSIIAYKINMNGAMNTTIGSNYSTLGGTSPLSSSTLYE
ncbi:MAG: pilus assembly protein TadG-related protein [Candidatus Binataceae bacterium]